MLSGDLRRRCSVLRESREARAGAAAGKAAPCWPCSARCVGAPHSKNAAPCEAPAARRLSLTGSGGGVEGRPRLFLCQQPWELALALGCGSRCRRADVRLRAAVGAPRAWKHGRACNAVRGRWRAAGAPQGPLAAAWTARTASAVREVRAELPGGAKITPFDLLRASALVLGPSGVPGLPDLPCAASCSVCPSGSPVSVPLCFTPFWLPGVGDHKCVLCGSMPRCRDHSFWTTLRAVQSQVC